MFEQLKDLLVEQMSLNPDSITPDAELVNDLGLNSLEMADMVVICEDKFDITFAEEDLPGLMTIGDIVKYIDDKTGGR